MRVQVAVQGQHPHIALVAAFYLKGIRHCIVFP